MARSILAIAILLAVNVAHAQSAHLEWMDRVTDLDAHHAFTDLIYWRDAYYLCFREGRSHASFDGQIKVLRSPDMRSWEEVATFNTLGDDRDPHFTATEDALGEPMLFVYFGVWDMAHGSAEHPPARRDVRSHAALSYDGETWTKVLPAYEPGWWLWRVRRLKEMHYTVAYEAHRRGERNQGTRVLRSRDGLHNWELLATLEATAERLPTEADFWFEDSGNFVVIARDDAPKLGSASALYLFEPNFEHWKVLGLQLGERHARLQSPVIVPWRDRVFTAGRYSGTSLLELKDDTLIHLCSLPSKGDTGYPGLIVDPATKDADRPAFIISWYSQHENPEPENNHGAAVYVGRIVLDDERM